MSDNFCQHVWTFRVIRCKMRRKFMNVDRLLEGHVTQFLTLLEQHVCFRGSCYKTNVPLLTRRVQQNKFVHITNTQLSWTCLKEWKNVRRGTNMRNYSKYITRNKCLPNNDFYTWQDWILSHLFCGVSVSNIIRVADYRGTK
jgi:hypothetical protein